MGVSVRCILSFPYKDESCVDGSATVHNYSTVNQGEVTEVLDMLREIMGRFQVDGNVIEAQLQLSRTRWPTEN